MKKKFFVKFLWSLDFLNDSQCIILDLKNGFYSFKFQTGASHYGIGDLEALVRDTHKFESRYIDNLIAPYSAETIKIYKERSPINYVDQLNCAMAFFQGDEDKVWHSLFYVSVLDFFLQEVWQLIECTPLFSDCSS